MPEPRRTATATSPDTKQETEEKMGEAATDFESANKLGYFGQVPDPEPNEKYTVKGVT